MFMQPNDEGRFHPSSYKEFLAMASTQIADRLLEGLSVEPDALHEGRLNDVEMLISVTKGIKKLLREYSEFSPAKTYDMVLAGIGADLYMWTYILVPRETLNRHLVDVQAILRFLTTYADKWTDKPRYFAESEHQEQAAN